MTIQQFYKQTKVMAVPQFIGEASMNSLEIAELVQKRHDNVRRTIETLGSKGVIRLPQIEDFEKINNLGLPSKVSVHVFSGKQGKRDSLIVVAQLCPEFTACIVDRWQELEEMALTTTPQKAISRKDLALMVIQAEEENDRLQAENQFLEQKIDEVKPVVEAFERIAVADGSLNITEAAKALQIQPKQLFSLLSKDRWIYKRPGGLAWLGYQAKIQQGLVEHKITTVERSDGSAKTVEQVRITPKGLTQLAQHLSGVTA